jgi:hypothetical protein
MSPYGDPVNEKLKAEFRDSQERAHRFIAGATPEPTATAEGRPYLVLESGDPEAVLQATNPTKARPELKGSLRPGREGVRFEDLEHLKSIHRVPGGVALGRVASVEGNWSDAGLIYVAAERRLMFVLPSKEPVKLPPVDPAVLKTSYLFARSGNPVAISIGYPGDLSPPGQGAVSSILLHAELRDTRVGLDIINTDRLPWSLRHETLPNGKPNPFFAEMKTLVPQADSAKADLPIKALLERLKPFADLDEYITIRERAELRAAAWRLLQGKSRFDFLLQAIRDAKTTSARFDTFVQLEDEDLLQQLHADLVKEYASSPGLEPAQQREILRRIEGLKLAEILMPDGLAEIRADQERLREFMSSLPADRDEALRSALILAVLPRDRVAWRFALALTLSQASSLQGADQSLRTLASRVLHLMEPPRLSLLTDSWVELVKSGYEMAFHSDLRVRYLQGRIVADEEGLSCPDDVIESREAGVRITVMLPLLENVYPPLRRTREYAQWIALMRWALQKGNIAWLDLADLGPIKHRSTPTPDYLIRGTPRQIEGAAKEFGIKLKPK